MFSACQVSSGLVRNGLALLLVGAAAWAATFTNPLLPSGADPWVAYKDGNYYYMQTTGANLAIWKTADITDLKDAPRKVVWRPPPTGPYSHDIWAPELHWLNGKWYIYFAADAGKNDSHRIWVVENPSADPTTGEWTLKGKASDPSDHWAIDASVFENGGQLYMVWSGWPGDQDGEQDIYIAHMSNPWTVDSKRVKLSSPKYGWETHGDLPGRHVDVNEGPEVIGHGNRLFLVYSGSGCWTDDYELGMLTASVSSDPMKAASWKKSPKPVLTGDARAHAVATGHNGFFASPDGKQDWIIYHANAEPGQGCGTQRSPRAQPFTWNADGTPNFGAPVPMGAPVPKPSGIN